MQIASESDPLRTTGALNTRIPKTICRTLLALQQLLRSDSRVGARFLPYFQYFLPSFSLLKSLSATFGTGHSNVGRKTDSIDYGQRLKCNVDDLVEQTLKTLEKTGGAGALAAIKFLVPTFTNVRV
jgi:hypothetical protein